MKKCDNLRLCGGTFFLLLLEARKQRLSAKEYYLGCTDGLSELNTLIGLAKILVPDLEEPLSSMKNTLQGNVHEFKACKSNGGQYFCFADTAARFSFDSVVKEKYQVALNRMRYFIYKFLDVNGSMKKDYRLARALVDLIYLDDSISDETLFFINKDGSTSTKRELLDARIICLDSFLLGIWHFAILRPEGNTIGKDTFDILCPSKGGGKRFYEGHLGESLKQSFSLTTPGIPTEDSDNSTDNIADFKILDDESQQNDDQTGTTENSYEGSYQQTIHNPTIFQQQGNHNVQIGHVAKLNIKELWSDDDEQ